MKTNKKTLVLLIAALSLNAGVLNAVDYEAHDVTISCHCRTTEVLELVGNDWTAAQKAQIWADWQKPKPEGFGCASGDYVGEATRRYNCHAYVYYGTNRWVNSRYAWLETSLEDAGGCWVPAGIDPEGTPSAYSMSNRHSCLIADELGKCGSGPLLKNNSNIYGELSGEMVKQ